MKVGDYVYADSKYWLISIRSDAKHCIFKGILIGQIASIVRGTGDKTIGVKASSVASSVYINQGYYYFDELSFYENFKLLPDNEKALVETQDLLEL